MHQDVSIGTAVGLDRAPAARKSFGFMLFCWAVYLVTSPINVFPAGYPQPADGLMAFLAALLLIGYGVRLPKHPTLYLFAAAFLVDVAVVNWFWWIQYKDMRLALSSVYYVYNFLVFLFVVAMCRKHGFSFTGVTRASLMIAAVIVLVGCFVIARDMRAIGTFNNPNQLGYWSLLATACVLVLRGDERLRLSDLVFLALTTYLTMLSLSKAALLSTMALVVTAVVGHGVEKRLQVAAVVLVLAATPALVVGSETIGLLSPESTLGKVTDRLANIGEQQDDTLEARGYDRLWLYPEYLLLGAGEGGFERFRLSANMGSEIHSSIATLLFSYGLVGAAFLGVVIYLILRNAPWLHIFYFGAVSFYGLTHQGLRFSLLWVFLGLIYGIAHYIRPMRRSPGFAGQPAGTRRTESIGRRTVWVPE